MFAPACQSSPADPSTPFTLIGSFAVKPNHRLYYVPLNTPTRLVKADFRHEITYIIYSVFPTKEGRKWVQVSKANAAEWMRNNRIRKEDGSRRDVGKMGCRKLEENRVLCNRMAQ